MSADNPSFYKGLQAQLIGDSDRVTANVIESVLDQQFLPKARKQIPQDTKQSLQRGRGSGVSNERYFDLANKAIGIMNSAINMRVPVEIAMGRQKQALALSQAVANAATTQMRRIREVYALEADNQKPIPEDILDISLFAARNHTLAASLFMRTSGVEELQNDDWTFLRESYVLIAKHHKRAAFIYTTS